MKKILLLALFLFTFSKLFSQSGSGWEWASISGKSNQSPGRGVKDIATDANGNVYVTGYFMGSMTLGSTTITTLGDGTVSGNYDQDAFIAKYDASGNVLWLKKYGIAALGSNQLSQVITVDASNDVYIGGSGLSTSTGNSAFLVKYDTNGNLLWEKKDFPLYEVGGINIGPDGNPIVMESNGGAKNIYKINKTTGAEIWKVANTGVGSNASTTYQDFVDAQGNVYYTAFMGGAGTAILAGQSVTTSNLTTFIASVDNNGVKRWVDAIDNVQVQLSYTIDKNGKSYIQIGGGFGGAFQGVSTNSYNGNRYLELDNNGVLTKYSVSSPYKGLFRVKDDGIYGYENAGGTTVGSYTEVFGDYYFTPPSINSKSLGIVIKYNATNNQVIWANSFEVNGADYVPGGIVSFEIGTNNKVLVGGNFGTSIKTGSTTYNTSVGAGYSPTDMFVAQFSGSNVSLPPTTNWTGAVSKLWTDAANWDNGVPNGNERSVIPAGLSNYPQNIPTTSITGKLTVANGVSFGLPVGFKAPGGLVNNGSVTVLGTGTFQGFNTSTLVPVSGTGRLVFTSASPSYILNSFNNDLEINCPAGISIYGRGYGGDLTGSLIMTQGMLNVAIGTLYFTNPNASITYSPTSYITGSINRAVNASGTYIFPIGTSDKFSPVTLQTNNLAGVKNISVNFNSSSSGTTPNITLAGKTVSTLLNNGAWTITPDATPTSGNYNATLETRNYTNGVTDATRYVVIKRGNSTLPWGFEGTNGTSTQTGGTINGAVVSNGTVNASSSGITAFSDFAIAIASAGVPPGTTAITSTWTGNGGNTTWTNAANWDNGVPDASVKTVIPAGLSIYPTGITTANSVAQLTIGTGVNLILPIAYRAGLGITNNGNITVSGSGTFQGFGDATFGYSPLSGSGKLVFVASSPTGISGTFPQSIELNQPGSEFNTQGSISGSLTLTNGTIRSTALIMTNPNATVTASATSYILGRLTRAVNTNGTYNFPVGVAAKNSPFTVTVNDLTGPKFLTVGFIDLANYGAAGTAPNTSAEGQTVTKLLDNGYWTMTADAAIVSGSYSVAATAKGFTNPVPDASKYVIVKRNTYTNPWTYEGTKINASQTATLVNAGASGLTLLIGGDAGTDFAIGIEGTTVTNWTGAANNGSWNDANNWDDGVPNSSIKAVFVAGKSNYPTTFPTAPTAEMLDNAAGTTIKLPQDFNAAAGILNNGSIQILDNGSTFSGFGNLQKAMLSGSGKLVFTPTGPSGISGTINSNIEVNKNLSVSQNCIVGGSINILSGYISVPLNGAGSFLMSNPTSTVTLANPANGFFLFNMSRTVSPSGTYLFPVGNNGYNPATITTNAVAGTTSYRVFTLPSADAPSKLFADGQPILYFLSECDWAVIPNAPATAGTLNLTFEGRGYTKGVTDASRYVLFMKVLGSQTWVRVPNATVTETAGVLTASATNVPALGFYTDFLIGVKGFTTQWTGAANNQAWSTAGNWSAGVPNSTFKAAFVAGSPNYPTGITATNFSNAIEIADGVTLQLPYNYQAANGIVNNGTIEVTGAGPYTGLDLLGSGKILFSSLSPATVSNGAIINNSVEINRISPITMTATIKGSLILTSALVYGNITLDNPNSTIDYSSSSYIVGNLMRTVNASGTYKFPVGNNTYFSPVILQLNNIVGPKIITTTFSPTINGAAPNVTVGGKTVSTLLNAGIWTITPDNSLTAGNYTVTLEETRYSNGLPDANASNYVVLKRANSSFAWGFFGDNGTASQNSNGKYPVTTATAGNITGFSDFAIGIANGPVLTTLPVKMIAFTAKAQGNATNLTWQTATEKNNDKFIIERSLNGNQFFPIGEVKGDGNYDKTIYYSYRDNIPQSGTNYYRLKQVDFDGKFEYSEVKVVDFKIGNQVNTVIYPNPVTSFLNISVPAYKVGIEIGIYTIQGVKVKRYLMSKALESVNIAELTKGIYIVKVFNSATGSVMMEDKIVKL